MKELGFKSFGAVSAFAALSAPETGTSLAANKTSYGPSFAPVLGLSKTDAPAFGEWSLAQGFKFDAGTKKSGLDNKDPTCGGVNGMEPASGLA